MRGGRLVVFVHLAQSAVERVFAVLGYVAVYFGLVDVGRLKPLGQVLTVTSVVRWIDLLVLAPPRRIDHRVDRCRPCTFLGCIVRIVDLEPVLRPIPWYTTRQFFRAFAAPRRWGLFHDMDSLGLLLAGISLVVSGCLGSGGQRSCLHSSAGVLQRVGHELGGNLGDSGMLFAAALICRTGRPLRLVIATAVRLLLETGV